jgi:D-3-phosphoglycerate dehydrogenase
LQNSDFVSVHTALNEKTMNLISAKEFAQMKPTTYLINTARGGIVNEQALVDALKQGKIAGAGLDVYWGKTPFDSKIMSVSDKVVFSPHIGSNTREAQIRIGELIVKKIKDLSDRSIN